MNIPDSHDLPGDAPLGVCRDLDAVTGYRSRSILAVPMRLIDGECVGVIELVNHLDADGRIGPFPDDRAGALDLLASMAAGAIHNTLARQRVNRANLNVIIDLSVAAECGDDETAGHIVRVSEVAALIAEAMGLSARQVEVTRFATTMHDVGTIGVPERILHKDGLLDAEERETMQRHAEIGAEVVPHALNDVIEAAWTVALTHHERWDGSGYPDGLAGEEIPLIGRIVAVADVFDALLSPRGYRDAHTWDQALRIVHRQAGRHFDPKVVGAFCDSLVAVAEVYRNLPTFNDAA
jgi:HD-GYP domain-containing protein (c-di-GMP phosphodiesterase class II)